MPPDRNRRRSHHRERRPNLRSHVDDGRSVGEAGQRRADKGIWCEQKMVAAIRASRLAKMMHRGRLYGMGRLARITPRPPRVRVQQ